ncbi:MAG: S1C family serine protease [Acidimicrobiales bacterium]
MSDTPEQPDEGEPGPEEGGGAGPDEPESPLRGWIDPDDRLWRHPSEVTAGGAGPGPAGKAGGDRPVLLNAPPRRAYRSTAMVLIGVAAVVAAAAWVVVLLSPASQKPLSSATGGTVAGAPLTTLAGPENAVPAAAQAAGRSMVELRATTAHGTVVLIGVAVAEGGIVVTTADLLGGVRRIVMVGPGGKLEPASIVAKDATSDVALVDVPVDVPVAPFANDTGLNGGSPDLLLSFVPAGTGSLALHCTPGAVTGVGTAIAGGPAGGMPAITSSAATATVAAGDPLLDSSGGVVGILYDPDPGTSSPVAFLPSDLVVGVADDLRSSNRVVHGWLGVSGTDAPNGGGATVESVQAKGPAAGRLQSGQVIVAVNALPVHTMAELRSRLYVLAPGAAIALSVQQGSGTKVVDVTLSASS